MEEHDVNADLIGYEFIAGGHLWTVTGTPDWSDGNYVAIESEEGARSCRPAGIVRRSREIDEQVAARIMERQAA